MTIDVISLGTSLVVPDSASAAIKNADVIIGAKRHFAAVDCNVAETIVYPSPIDKLADVLKDNAGKKACVLASGDALFFGIGGWLLRNCDPAQLQFHPNVTTVQTACARIGRPWQNVQPVSLHGRPMRRLRAVLVAGQSLAVFTDSKNTPNAIGRELVDTGYGGSTVHIFESLDTDAETISEFTATGLAVEGKDFQPLNLLLVDVHGTDGLLPAFPGIEDSVFAEGGDTQFTKREVRLAALSRLALKAGEVGWDIGAGSGGIAIEWARWSPLAQIYAVERDEDRRHYFQVNRDRFGDHGNLELIAGEAPATLENLPAPNAVYVGGSGGDLSAVLDACWDALQPGGRMVTAGVTVETRAALSNRSWPVDADFSEIAISHSAPLGSHTTMRAQLPVLLATVVKA